MFPAGRANLDTSPSVTGLALLKPYPEHLMDVHDVSTIVNSAKYDGPDCIQPVETNEQRGQLSLL
ncbi:MAG TPA: hypothetical protein VEG60_33845 [Candidatus Binatia bacterium]|nr:hypothetical protein [Candidatus Binatia bacterium]